MIRKRIEHSTKTVPGTFLWKFGSICFLFSLLILPPRSGAEPPKPSGSMAPPEQIRCPSSECIELPFRTHDLDNRVDDLMEEDAGMILVNLENTPRKLDSDRMDDMRMYLTQIASRGGRIIVEPLEIQERSMIPLSSIPVVKDFLLVSVNIFERVYNYFRYMETEDYNAKVVYNPLDGNRVLYLYFVHRKYGDICKTLYSDCDSLEYFDDRAFDLELSRRLRESRNTGKPVRVTFGSTRAHLPSDELSLENIEKTGSSLRVYKWFLAADEVEALPRVRERFIPLALAVNIIDLGLKLYDLAEDLILYEPATDRVLRVQYEGEKKGGSIREMVFLPESNPSEREKSSD